MEILRFIRWNWNRISRGDKQFLLAVLMAIVAGLISGLVFNAGIVIVLLSVILAAFGTILGVLIYEKIRESWEQYV